MVDSASHLPHLTAQALVLEKIGAFINQSKYQLDKQQVAHSFGRAARAYDSAAHVQKWSGKQLLSALDMPKNPKSIVDLGCGTGAQTALLNKLFPQAEVTGVDFQLLRCWRMPRLIRKIIVLYNGCVAMPRI